VPFRLVSEPNWSVVLDRAHVGVAAIDRKPRIIERWSASTRINVEDESRLSRLDHLRRRGGVAVTEDRPIEAILTEWRAIERELEATEGEARRALDARIERLREEHRQAVASRESEAQELRGR
jgi:hypothetical protein